MFRSLNDILSIQQDKSDVVKILNDPHSDKEKLILGFRFIYCTDKAEIGFAILKNIKGIDTCDLITDSFIEELLKPFYRPNSASKTLKILQFILENASQPESFEMAIHQHMAQYAQSGNIETANLQHILELINLITSRLNTPSFSNDFLRSMCVVIIKKLAEVPVTRDTNIKTMSIDCGRIIEFFQMLNSQENCNVFVLRTVYETITKDGDVSALACLGLSVIPDTHIGNAVQHILNLNAHLSNQKKSIMNSIGRLLNWQRTTSFNVPLHLWIVKIMRALYDEKHFEILNEIISEHVHQSFLTLLLPAYQTKTFQVVQVMLEVQRSEEIFKKIAPRFLNLMSRLSKEKSEIAEPVMDLLAEYIGSFPDFQTIASAETIQYLEAHGRDIEQSRLKYRPPMAYNALSSNVRIGLENLGNTCYINSVIQALFMIKPFCYELLHLERSDRGIMAVQKIFALLSFSNRSELNLKFAMQLIRPVDFLPGIQHDSTEFMASLLDKLHEADKKHHQRENGTEASGEENMKMDITTDSTPTINDGSENMEDDEPELSNETTNDHTTELNESTIIHKNFGGKMSTTCICMSCEYRSVSIDAFRDLSLSFPEKPKNEDDWDVETEYSVQELLDYFFKPEQLSVDNQYHCDRCKALCDGMRCNAVLESPKNLILTLKHFSYDSRYHTRSKLLINKMFHNKEISLNVTQGSERRAVEYQLQAAVVHSGISVDSGHYYTFASEKDRWYKFNDSYVSDSSLIELNNLNSPNTPYILFYRRISSASSTASSSTACSSDQIINVEEKLNLEALPQFLRTCILDDNAAYEKESKKFIFPQNKVLAKSNRWNDDDPPPSSCGSNLDVQHNRFIY